MKHSKPRDQTAQAYNADSDPGYSFVCGHFSKLRINFDVWK